MSEGYENAEACFKIELLEFQDKTFGVRLEVSNIFSVEDTRKLGNLLAEWLTQESGWFNRVQ